MTLDERARRAVDGLKQAVAAAPVPVVRRERKTPLRSLAAGALAAGAVLAVLFVARSQVLAPEYSDGTGVATTAPIVSTTTAAVFPTTPNPSSVSTAPVPTTVAPTPSTTASDVTPPPLAISFPEAGYVSETNVLRFEGTTEVGATVSVGPYRADVDRTGHWSLTLVLRPGNNIARFQAADAAGNTATAAVMVEFRAPTTTIATAEFAARFTWGECSLVPPYDEYHGTGQPGSKVTVSSPFGGGSTTVKESGEWYLKVEFPEAPINETFVVDVVDSLGRRAAFEFTARSPG